MMQIYPSDDLAENIIRISQIPPQQRTRREITTLKAYLSTLELFKKKVVVDSLDDVLKQATKYIKYTKIAPNEFLYHIRQPSTCIYFVIKGEAWKFREKTQLEYERDLGIKKKKTKKGPKILETIALAKALNDRNRIATQPITPSKVSIASPTAKNIPLYEQIGPLRHTGPTSGQTVELKNIEGFRALTISLREHEEIETKIEEESKNNQSPRSKTEYIKQFKEELLSRLKATNSLLNFENNYLSGLMKRNSELAARYTKEKISTLKFEKKLGPSDILGETSMSLNQTRNSCVLAYTELHVLYFDIKSYEKVFFAEIEEFQEKIQFFREYFGDISFNKLKRICFLFTEKKFKLGETIYKEGGPVDNIYFIKSGEVQLMKNIKQEESPLTTPRKTQQKNVLVASVLDGHFFGEEGLSNHQTRNFTAKSVLNLHCYVLSIQVLPKLPERVVCKLKELSSSKQTWRDDRLEIVKKKPSIAAISTSQTPLEPGSPLKKNKSKDTSGANSPERKKLQEIRIKEGIMTTWEGKEIPLASSPSVKNEFMFFSSVQLVQEPPKTERSRRPRIATTATVSDRSEYLPVSQQKERNLMSRKKERFLREPQRALTLSKISGFPTPLRTPNKHSSRVFDELSPLSCREAVAEDKEPSTLGLPLNKGYNVEEDDNDFNFNFVTKSLKTTKNVDQKKQLELITRATGTSPKSRGQSKETRDISGNNETKESREGSQTRPVQITRSDIRSLTLANISVTQMKERFICLSSRKNSEYFYQKRRHESKPSGGLTIKSSVPSQEDISSILKSFQDYKGSSTKEESTSAAGSSFASLPRFKAATVVLKKKFSTSSKVSKGT